MKFVVKKLFVKLKYIVIWISCLLKLINFCILFEEDIIFKIDCCALLTKRNDRARTKPRQ